MLSVKDVLCVLLAAMNDYVEGGPDRSLVQIIKPADSEGRKDGGHLSWLYVIINLRDLDLCVHWGIEEGGEREG